MRRFLSTIFTVVLSPLFFPCFSPVLGSWSLQGPFGHAQAQETTFGLNTVASVYTDYMFRGKNVYNGTTFQPSVTAFVDFEKYGALVGNVWSHVPFETSEPPQKFTEVDYTLSYEIPISIVTLSVGHIFYTFPSGEGRIADTVEYFAEMRVDTFLNPSFTFFNDYDEGRYQYYALGFDHTFSIGALGPETDITPYVTFGFASNANDNPVFYFDNGLVHVDAGLSMDIPLGVFFLTPEFNFTFENDDAANNEFWAGIAISYAVS